MFDWNDLKYFLAVARHGSTIAAGKALGLSQSTVQRRLEELERRGGPAPVMRQPSGHPPTQIGHIMLPPAEPGEATLCDFPRRTADAQQGMKGVVRVTPPPPI